MNAVDAVEPNPDRQCKKCPDFELNPFVQHRKKMADGHWGRLYVFEARYCPECGRKLGVVELLQR